MNWFGVRVMCTQWAFIAGQRLGPATFEIQHPYAIQTRLAERTGG
jgi:hypothetical protein